MGGHGRVRLRETYLRDVVAPLLNSSASGVVKVDLALRALARRNGELGLIDPDITYDALHDLCRPVDFYGQATKLKRKWVSEKVERLTSLGLLLRTMRPGRRPQLMVLRDDGSQLPLDDPGESSERYASFFGDAFQHGHMARWGSPQIAAYLAAMVAERYARTDPQLAWLQGGRPFGSGIWFRSLDWFEDPKGLRPPDHVRIPFSSRTLRRGFTHLRDDALIASIRALEDPRTGQPFKTLQGRYIYFNGFSDMRGLRRTLQPDWAALLKRPEAAPEPEL